MFSLLISCDSKEEGLLGEWEGTYEKVGSDGQLFEADASCLIRSATMENREVNLKVGGANYDFTAIEQDLKLIFNNKALNQDSSIIFYISGSAELLYDTLLHFEYETYSMKGNQLLIRDEMELDLTRK